MVLEWEETSKSPLLTEPDSRAMRRMVRCLREIDKILYRWVGILEFAFKLGVTEIAWKDLRRDIGVMRRKVEEIEDLVREVRGRSSSAV